MIAHLHAFNRIAEIQSETSASRFCSEAPGKIVNQLVAP
jgi:hypothetical protein